MIRRRTVVVALLTLVLISTSVLSADRIDRRALVMRHRVVLDEPDPLTPLSVGNGEFAFNADITGLQTFSEYHQQGTPLCTQSQWGWHTQPNPEGYKIADALEDYEVNGRNVPYLSGAGTGGYSPAALWLRGNPHRLHLGRIGLKLTKSDGTLARMEDLTGTLQALDLWKGSLHSRFDFDGHSVHVGTVCHPSRDLVAVRIMSTLVEEGRLGVSLSFPYGKADWRDAADWGHPERHTTEHDIRGNQMALTRTLDADRYYVRAAWSDGGQVRAKSQHEYEIAQSNGKFLEVVVAFSPTEISEYIPEFDTIESAAAKHWARFWLSGGAIDFSQCTDPRAAELERRVVLSQYLMAINCSGSRPPQETGLVYNSWFGKFHLEMHWWHGVHFALWDRLPLLERSLSWYDSILPAARGTAQLQGYQGARWPKMTEPDGRDSPSSVGVFLIWQQPHPIYYAELCYRAHSDHETLRRYRDVVFETAEFMASYPVWDEARGRYVLGPALIPAQESYGRFRRSTLNPTFELAYWHWALETAQKWRQRLGMDRDAKWDHVLQYLSRPTVRKEVYPSTLNSTPELAYWHWGLEMEQKWRQWLDPKLYTRLHRVSQHASLPTSDKWVYTGIETEPYTIIADHPSMLCALGVLPRTPWINPLMMKWTLDFVLAKWDWPSTWGWDYPVMAMTAARVDEPEKAIDALFVDAQKNRYLANGHNYQSARLPVYLPGNGGLLTAVAMMAAGWDGCPDRPAPGFPNNGKWNVRWEGLRRMP
jgi:hypothetical protein